VTPLGGYGYGGGCCGLLGGTYGVAPLGSTGGVLVPSGGVLHDTFGTARELESPPVFIDEEKSRCVADWRFLPDSSTELYGQTYEHIGPVCASGISEFTGLEFLLFIEAAQVAIGLGYGLAPPVWAAFPGSNQVVVRLYKRFFLTGFGGGGSRAERYEFFYLDPAKPCTDLQGVISLIPGRPPSFQQYPTGIFENQNDFGPLYMHPTSAAQVSEGGILNDVGSLFPASCYDSESNYYSVEVEF
jgi:hypothetical protein